MANPVKYGFQDRLMMSQEKSSSSEIKAIILSNIPSAVAVHQSHEANDRSGVDWWVECENGKMLGVDCKVRSVDWANKPDPKDDVALETWSVVEKGIVGWTRDTNKQTDYILWYWRDTGRWMLVPFQMLCKVFCNRWEEWSAQHQTARQNTPGRNGGCGYHSECVYIPRHVLWREIYLVFSGCPAPAKRAPEPSHEL